MKKVIVIGCPGSGKSFFSKKLKEKLDIPLYHIDMIYHKNDRTHITTDELIEKLKEVFNKDTWIIDGNYQKTLELRLKECDTVFLMDFPTEVCLQGAINRIGTNREDLPWVEDKLDENFKESILKFKDAKLPKIYELLNTYKENLNIVIFKSREEVDNYINML